MMMTEKYYSLPPTSSSSSSSSSPSSSTITKTKKKNRNLPIFNDLHSMKLFTQQPYSLHDVVYDKKTKYFDLNDVHSNASSSPSSSTSTGDTLQSVLVNTLHQTIDKHESYGSTLSRTMMNTAMTGKRRTQSSSQILSPFDHKRSQNYSSLISKRTRTYSLTNHLTMSMAATTSFSEEQDMTSMEYENTYFYPEETTRFDDILSLTTITSNLQAKRINSQLDLSACSDTNISQSDVEDNFETIVPIVQQYGDTYQFDMGNDNLNTNNNNNNNQIIQIRLCLTPPDQETFTGVVHAKKCTIVKDQECLSDYDNIKETNKKIMIISNRNENFNHQVDVDDDHYSDVSNSSDDFKYLSDAARSSCTSDDLNNTSSTLRQEAISLTRVRCKRRKTWIRSPTLTKSSTTHHRHQHRLNTDLIQPFLSVNQVTGTHTTVNSTTIRNQTRVKPFTSTMLLHNNSLNCNNNNNNNNNAKDGETLSYDFFSANNESSMLKTNELFDKEKLSPKSNKKFVDCYQTSLSPVKRLLNESIDSNIEIIQMDEQECVFEIVDGILTIVPKDNKPLPSSLASSSSTPSLSEQDHQADLLDLFSVPLISTVKQTSSKTLLDDSISSVSSYGEHGIENPCRQDIPRSSSPINSSSLIKDTLSPSVESQTRSNKNTLLSQLLQTVKKVSANNEDESNVILSSPKQSALPIPKPINKDRINEFASLLSSSVHLSQPQSATKKSSLPTKVRSSPSRSEETSFSTIPSVSSTTERDSYHTVQSEVDQTKKSIDARYNDRLDDRSSIQIKTANIKALFEQKISETYKTISQSTEHLTHLNETRPQHRKIPISYGSLRKNLPNYQQQSPSATLRRRSYQEPVNMNKYSEGKDVVIEEKQIEDHLVNTSPIPTVVVAEISANESLLAREIRETKEKEEELKRQRKKCGLSEDISLPNNPTVVNPPVRNSSFLSNLDFFTSKSTSSASNSSRKSSIDECKQMSNVVSQELNRFNDNGVSIIRTSSTNGLLQRSTSNQNILATQTTNNIIQREIEAIRAKEAELRQLGRIQHTSDEHADPRKYQELVMSTLPKSQSIQMLSTGKVRRDSENRSNGFSKPKVFTNTKVPCVNSTVSIDYSKLTTTDRLELEKRQCQEREQELKKQRNSMCQNTSSNNTTINGDSGNVSQEEHDDDQERYLEKIERIKRTENQKAQAPLIRPIKKLDMSQKWEQMMANKIDD